MCRPGCLRPALVPWCPAAWGGRVETPRRSREPADTRTRGQAGTRTRAQTSRSPHVGRTSQSFGLRPWAPTPALQASCPPSSATRAQQASTPALCPRPGDTRSPSDLLGRGADRAPSETAVGAGASAVCGDPCLLLPCPYTHLPSQSLLPSPLLLSASRAPPPSPDSNPFPLPNTDPTDL